MAAQKMYSAKRKRIITNTIVHTSLAVLAAVWVFPDFLGDPHKLPRGEGLVCIDLLSEGVYT